MPMQRKINDIKETLGKLRRELIAVQKTIDDYEKIITISARDTPACWRALLAGRQDHHIFRWEEGRSVQTPLVPYRLSFLVLPSTSVPNAGC